MNTIAIWYESKSTKPDLKSELDIHINFWKAKKIKRGNDYLLDLGLMIYDLSITKNVFIHFPFKITRTDLKDLGDILLHDHKTVNSIFNENYDIHDSGNAVKQKNIQDTDGSPIFNIYALDMTESSKDIKIVDEYNGTTLTINTDSIPIQHSCNKYYFRFRLKGKILENFIKEYVPNNWFFQSAMTSTDAIDFRINEKRNFDDSLAEEILSKETFQIEKIHFLLMRKATDDLIADHLKITCRELEEDWGNYVGLEYNIKNTLVYHWFEKYDDAKKKRIESFNTLVKIKYHKSNFKTILIYILIAGVISISFNLLSNLMYNIPNKTETQLLEIIKLTNQNNTILEANKVLNLNEGEINDDNE